MEYIRSLINSVAQPILRTVPWEEMCIRNEESQVHRPTHCVQRVWMAKLAVPSRSGVSGVSSVDHIELLRHSRNQHRAAVKALGTSCRMSIQVDTAKRDQDNWKLSNEG